MPELPDLAHLCFSLELDDGAGLRYGDERRMGTVHVVSEGARAGIPGWREQVRVFVMDQTTLCAIGKA